MNTIAQCMILLISIAENPDAMTLQSDAIIPWCFTVEMLFYVFYVFSEIFSLWSIPSRPLVHSVMSLFSLFHILRIEIRMMCLCNILMPEGTGRR